MTVEELNIRPVEDADISALISLWQSAGVVRPWNDPKSDIARVRQCEHSQILVGLIGSQVVASVMVGEDGHRGWVYYVATVPILQNNGHGRAIMNAAENWLATRGVLKLNLLVRNDNADACSFYERLGYQQSDVVCFQKIITTPETN